METKKKTRTETQAEKEYYKLLDKLKKIEHERAKEKKEQQREEYLCK